MWLGHILRETEIQQLGLPTLSHKDVGGFDITMNDPLAVRCVQSIGNLDAHSQNGLGIQGPTADAMLKADGRRWRKL